MTPERWKKVEEIFNRAIELPESDRAAFIESSCADDPELWHSVHSMLQHDTEQLHILQTVISNAAGSLSDDETGDYTGKRVGPYRITGLIGHGGMAKVYKAIRDDDQYQKQVAIKIIRRFSHSFLITRFWQERQILANLEHPSIARFLEGGQTGDGVPYLVMEYIEGVPITDYCSRLDLGIRERLKLFQLVCDAVQYAHRNLVIHRDLKPSNILVTTDGIPKLLDFGIAKLLNPDPDRAGVSETITALRIFTPEYASPEQVRGEPVTTAADVYSLGAVLYELLTGRLVHELKNRSITEVERVVCVQEPERPSLAATREKSTGFKTNRMGRELSGDLDNILLMALRKEPAQRYQSVEQFAQDLGRYLQGRTVIARQPTLVYRSVKFVKRHKAGVAAAALIVILLVGSVIGINQQRLRAERRFNEVRKLAHAVVFDYNDAISDIPGSTPVRQRLVKDALVYLDSLASDARDDPTLQRELADAYMRIGDIQGNAHGPNLGDQPAALHSYNKSLELYGALPKAEPENWADQRNVAQIHMRIGDIDSKTGKIGQAAESYRRAMVILEKSTAARPDDHVMQNSLAKIYSRIGDLEGNPYVANLGDTKAGLEYHRKALAIFEKESKANPSDAEVMADLENSHRTLAVLLLSDPVQAEQHARQGVAIAEKLIAADPKGVRAYLALASARDSLARVLISRNAWDDALAVYRKMLPSDQSMVTVDPKNMQARSFLATDYAQMADILRNQHKWNEALDMFRQALAMDQQIAMIDQGDVARFNISEDYLSIGDVLVKMGDLSGAELNQLKALEIQEELVKKDPENVQSALSLAAERDQYCETLALMGKHAKALEGFRQGVATGETILKKDPSNDPARTDLALRYFNIGKTAALLAEARNSQPQEKIGLWKDARMAYQRSLQLLQELQKKGQLPAEHADKPELIARSLAICDQALEKMTNEQ